MSLIQYEYIVAVDTYRSFVIAAEKCFVTQPTLSMQIQKLEHTLGIQIFNRKRQPILPTEIGTNIITQARVLLAEHQKIQEIVSDHRKELMGELKIGIIPTIAPYILPKIITQFMIKFPQVKLIMWEQTTEQIVQQLKLGLIDCGILSTPILETQLLEMPLFYENFVAYVSKNSELAKKKTIHPDDIDIDELWILNEGHCMRDQVLNICQRRESTIGFKHYEYNTGSIETLKRMVDENNGATILPEFALKDLTKSQLEKVRHFKSPQPAREISIVTTNGFTKKRLIETLKNEILDFVPPHMKEFRETQKKPLIAISA
ncbi:MULTISPECIES: LysR substrate-binding domain-containing protein [unclassified Mucilaginibacter]|uniref:hydrogen peroxide-inducible genes activator n=1 Tax=unclassified Mucilaginibacter TaxID=2617802 RepID=UPI002AC89ADD|nr:MULTISPECIES: LysR substrate-binding domain-containing protein [unclassified Mucilaginibacter]MEB0261966.1 LysR substrate-binding domain-containing protein [Mucilaginibacter sp. 10I4]MEB0277266.1 LysR substrate-binding domain-containing protein [Mucilaginibacter sp. 10B2]MEB0300870.1 LysR substrate-binding domain-containing protein [Mucilaginibacter sp. 5C4]WPX25393.1 LysR substrate-binding domain-containing protein [Mucilaginibacter sp. 5C4]